MTNSFPLIMKKILLIKSYFVWVSISSLYVLKHSWAVQIKTIKIKGDIENNWLKID